MSWTLKKKPSEQIQEYLDRRNNGGANRGLRNYQFQGQNGTRQTTRGTYPVGSQLTAESGNSDKTTLYQGNDKTPNVVVTLAPQTDTVSPNQEIQDLEYERKVAHQSAFADSLADLDAEFWRIAQNPGSMLSANESAYYSLYMKQYQERARDAETNAFTRASTATGGYGSSYATMAGEQAYRETMQEFDELVPSLMQSKSERMAEILQQREMMTSMAKEQGLSMSGNAEGPTQGASDAFNYILSLGENGWNGSNEAQIRAILNAQATAGGWTSEDVEAAIEMLKDIDMAQEEDSFKMFQRNPTLSGAVQIMAEAKKNGNTGAAFQQVTRIMYTEFAKAMNDLENAYSFIGVDKEEWESMKEDEREEAILNAGIKAVDGGILSKDAFGEIVKTSLNKNVENVIRGDKANRNKLALILDELYGVMAMEENGYITKEKLKELIDFLRSYDFIKTELKNNDRTFSGTRLEAYQLLKGEVEYRDAAGRTLSKTGEYLRDKILAIPRSKLENEDLNHRGGR